MNKKSGVDLYREIASNEMTSLDDLFSKLEDRAPQGMLGFRLQFLIGVATGLKAAGLINESEENLLCTESMKGFEALSKKYFKSNEI